MARIPRVVVPGYPHHVTQRGNRRQKTFFCSSDYHFYLELVSHYATLAENDVWAYCLMPNHVHLVMVPNTKDGLRAALIEAHRLYTRHINFRERWRDHLWQERFHSFFMDEKYLRATVRYVERNPVAARLCRSPEDWKWSSASAHLKKQDDVLVRVKPVLDRVHDWKSYLSAGVCDNDKELIDLHSRTSRLLGSRPFVQELEALTGKKPHSCALAQRRKGVRYTVTEIPCQRNAYGQTGLGRGSQR